MSKIKKITLSVLVFLGLIVGVFLFMFFYQGSTTDIKKVADQFASKPEWVKESETITPPKITCLGDNPCPSLYRTWKTTSYITRADFQEILQQSGWDLVIEDDCEPKGNVIGNAVLCTATGRVDKFEVEVWVDGDGKNKDDTKIILSLK